MVDEATPIMRSSDAAASAFAARAALGRFELQTCAECGAIFWPPRDVCGSCWSVNLDWRAVSPFGEVLVETSLHASMTEFFRNRLPWRIGTVRLDAGPIAIAHLADDAREGARVRMLARVDNSGAGVLIAVAEGASGALTDPKLLELARDADRQAKKTEKGRNE